MIRPTHQWMSTHSVRNPHNGWAEVQNQTLRVTFSVELEPRFEYTYPKRDGTPIMIEPDVLEVRYEWTSEKGWEFGKAELSGYQIKANDQPGQQRRANATWRPSGEKRERWPQHVIDVIVENMPRGSYLPVAQA